MRVMNKKQKEKFANATDRVIDLVGEEGEDPEEAIIKVANENDYGRWMTENLARSFNIGVSWHQIEKSGSLEEKLMEAPVVRSDMLGDKVADVDEDNQTRKVAHMNEFNGLQKDYIAEQNREESPLRKVASEIRKNRDEGTPRDKDLLRHFRKCAKLRDQLHLKMSSFGVRWENHMDRVADAVRSCDEHNHEIFKRASVALSEHSDEYVAMLADHMGEEDFAESLEKSGMRQFYMVDDDQSPYCHMKEGAELLGEAEQYGRAMDEVISEMKKIAERIDYLLPDADGVYRRQTDGPTGLVRSEDAESSIREFTENVLRGYEAAKKKDEEEMANAEVPATVNDTALVPTGQGGGGQGGGGGGNSPVPAGGGGQGGGGGGNSPVPAGGGGQGGGGGAKWVNSKVVPPAATVVPSGSQGGGGSGLMAGVLSALGDKWEDLGKGKPKGGPKKPERLNKLVDSITETAENLVSDEAGPVSLPASHEREINDLYSTAVLNRMLSSDPVLSQRPEDTIEMFNRVMEINPYVVRHPQVATSMTRRLVEASGRLDSSEVSKLEKSIGDTLEHLTPSSSKGNS